MDQSFDPTQFLKTAQDLFFQVQAAWNREDRATLRAMCGSELMQSWETELSGLKAQGPKNRMDNIALRDREITEGWTKRAGLHHGSPARQPSRFHGRRKERRRSAREQFGAGGV